MFWKSVRKYYCQQQGISGLEYVSAEEIKTLYSQSFCENALVPAESLLKYMTKKNEKNSICSNVDRPGDYHPK